MEKSVISTLKFGNTLILNISYNCQICEIFLAADGNTVGVR